MVWLRSGLLLVMFTVVEVEVLSRLRIFDVAAQVLLASAVAAGMTGGPERGALYGFAAGLMIDLYLPTPFGLSGISFAIAAFAFGFVAGRVVEELWLTRIGFVAVGSVLGTILYVLFGEAIGQRGLYRDDFVQVLAIIAALNALLGIGLVPLVGWMWDLDWDDRSRLALR